MTGASTGIGAATARELASRGYLVLAGVRRDSDADALRAERIEPHTLDITVDADVAAIAERVAHDPDHRPLPRSGQQRRDRGQRAGRDATHDRVATGSSRSTCSVTSR